MAEPTVNDAIEVLTDPHYKAPGQPSDAQFVRIAGKRVLTELRQRGANEAHAHELVGQALSQLGGEDRSELLEFEETAGGPAYHTDYVYVVPAASMRE